LIVRPAGSGEAWPARRSSEEGTRSVRGAGHNEAEGISQRSILHLTPSRGGARERRNTSLGASMKKRIHCPQERLDPHVDTGTLTLIID